MKEHIRNELRSGLTISEVCTEHGISFQQLCALMKKGEPINQENRSTGEKYISFLGGRYVLRKTLKRKMRYFGSYNSLEDAVKVRDYMIENGWYRNRLDNVCKKVGVKRWGMN